MNETLRIRTRLEGARQTRAELLGVAAGISTVGDAALVTSRKIDTANRSSFLYRQGLYTLRRGLYATTLTLGALGLGALTMGIRFDSSMEQNRISLGFFLGGTRAANKELAFLYQLAAKTPFEFGQVTDAARRFLGMGFAVGQTNDMLRILGDTVSGLGLGGTGLDRIAIVLGQIKASGRLLGNDLLQLTQAGIPAIPILQRELFGGNKAMTARLLSGQLQVPADQAIAALLRGLDRPAPLGFHGLARLQAGSGQGLASTALDYLRQLSGTVSSPLFQAGKRRLREFNPLLQDLTKAFKQKPSGDWDAFFATLDKGVGANGQIVEAWKELRAGGLAIGRIVRSTLVPAFLIFWKTLGLGSPPMRLFIGLLGFLSKHMTTVIIVTALLSAEMLYNKTLLLALFLQGRALTLGYFLLGRAIMAVRLATWLWNAALFANPVVLVTVAVLALAAALWLAIHRWNQFKKEAGFSPGGAFGNPFGKGGLFGPGGKLRPPGLAGGGTVSRGGSVWVGERGPELLNLPSRAEVRPLGKTGGLEFPALVAAIVSALQQVKIDVADVNLNERKVGEAVFRYKADTVAAH